MCNTRTAPYPVCRHTRGAPCPQFLAHHRACLRLGFCCCCCCCCYWWWWWWWWWCWGKKKTKFHRKEMKSSLSPSFHPSSAMDLVPSPKLLGRTKTASACVCFGPGGLQRSAVGPPCSPRRAGLHPPAFMASSVHRMTVFAMRREAPNHHHHNPLAQDPSGPSECLPTAKGGGGCGPHFPHFPNFFPHFPGRSLSVMFKRKHSSGIVL